MLNNRRLLRKKKQVEVRDRDLGVFQSTGNELLGVCVYIYMLNIYIIYI